MKLDELGSSHKSTVFLRRASTMPRDLWRSMTMDRDDQDYQVMMKMIIIMMIMKMMMMTRMTAS